MVVPRNDGEVPVTEDDIRQHVRAYSDKGRISRYAVPQFVRFVDTLEKTSVGKLNKRKLRERFDS